MKNNYEVACYHWSNWHRYAGNDRDRGDGWTEWEYLKAAIPRFVGHNQPKKPLWGYLDDTKKENAELQIDAASDHGLTSFIFDWGYANDDGFGGHGNNLALEEGFLKADNRDRLKFGLMWCGGYDGENFRNAADYMIRAYFNQPNYWRVNGGLYISIYEIQNFIKSNGGIEQAAECIKYLRDKTREAGYGEVHFAAIEFGLQDQHREIIGDDVKALVKKLTIDSVTSYAWCHNASPKEGLFGPYKNWAKDAMAFWPEFDKKFGVPYFPHISVGWDPSPRCHPQMQYKIKGPLLYHRVDGTYENVCEPYLSSIVTENTPEQFGLALLKARKHLDSTDAAQKVVTIYAWNEWTEGGNLEPEEQYGMGYLEAIKNVFGQEE